jgi:hypothetical protein
MDAGASPQGHVLFEVRIVRRRWVPGFGCARTRAHRYAGSRASLYQQCAHRGKQDANVPLGFLVLVGSAGACALAYNSKCAEERGHPGVDVLSTSVVTREREGVACTLVEVDCKDLFPSSVSHTRVSEASGPALTHAENSSTTRQRKRHPDREGSRPRRSCVGISFPVVKRATTHCSARAPTRGRTVCSTKRGYRLRSRASSPASRGRLSEG